MSIPKQERLLMINSCTFMDIRVKERSKMYSLLFVLVAMIALAACDDKKESSSLNPVEQEGKTYQQSVTLPAQDANKTVALNNLNAAIREMEGAADWLTVMKQSYTSGVPSVRLTAFDNTNGNTATAERTCLVTITATSGDRVLLTVTQEGYIPETNKTGIDDSHDVVTDQPAYSRRQ